MSNAIFHQQQYIQNSFLKNKAYYLSYSQPYSLPLKMLPLDSILIELCQPSKAKPRTKIVISWYKSSGHQRVSGIRAEGFKEWAGMSCCRKVMFFIWQKLRKNFFGTWHKTISQIRVCCWKRLKLLSTWCCTVISKKTYGILSSCLFWDSIRSDRSLLYKCHLSNSKISIDEPAGTLCPLLLCFYVDHWL